MKIYDISQEVFSCVVFPGDPAPEKETLRSISKGDICNLTAFSMCAHNGTHIDAPCHFVDGGKSVEQLPLSKTVGNCYVFEHNGDISAQDAENMLSKTECSRILIKGRATVTNAAAKVFAKSGLDLIGNESQTVGPENSPVEVHNILLGCDIVLLEGIRLTDVPSGEYLLSAAPLSLAGSDGAPCRAILIKI